MGKSSDSSILVKQHSEAKVPRFDGLRLVDKNKATAVKGVGSSDGRRLFKNKSSGIRVAKVGWDTEYGDRKRFPAGLEEL